MTEDLSEYERTNQKYDHACESTVFIEFTLSAIRSSIMDDAGVSDEMFDDSVGKK